MRCKERQKSLSPEKPVGSRRVIFHRPSFLLILASRDDVDPPRRRSPGRKRPAKKTPGSRPDPPKRSSRSPRGAEALGPEVCARPRPELPSHRRGSSAEGASPRQRRCGRRAPPERHSPHRNPRDTTRSCRPPRQSIAPPREEPPRRALHRSDHRPAAKPSLRPRPCRSPA